MFGLSLIDIAVIFVYFSVVIAIGFWAMGRIKNQEDYFLAGRRFGKVIQTMAAFSQAVSSENAVNIATTTAKNGAAGIWSGLCFLFSTPLYWIISPWYRRMRLLTLGDFFEERYQSKRMAGFYAIIQAMNFMIGLAIAFSAMGKTVVALTPKSYEQFTVAQKAEYKLAMELEKLESLDYSSLSAPERERLGQLRMVSPKKTFSHINKTVLIYIVALIALTYSAAGGLEAAFVTDTIQGVFIILLSVLMLPFAFVKINKVFSSTGLMGPFRMLHQQLPESFFEVFGSAKSIDFTWYYIAAVIVLITTNVAAQANQMMVCGSAKDENTARFGLTAGLFMKRFCTVMWGFFAITIVLLYGKSVHDTDLLWGHATRELLGPLSLGLVGLMIACLTAALMSTADCLMITTSGLLTHNLYRVLVTEKSERHYVVVGRCLGAVTVLGGVWIATQFESIFQLLKFHWEFGIFFAAPFWLGILWRRSNRQAAWSAISAIVVLFFVLPVIVPAVAPGLRTSPYLAKTTNPQPLQRTYTANEADVQMRNEEIARWEKLNATAEAIGPKPKPITAGEKFTRTYKLPRKSVFWRGGIKIQQDGTPYGRGSLSLELVLLDMLGPNLAENPYALNETIRLLFRIIVPFGIMIVVGYLTKVKDKEALDKFYAKMKTPVLTDRQADERELELSYANPHRLDHIKLFPNSSWEFQKWDKLDAVGFSVSVLVMFAIIGLFMSLLTIGK